MIVILRNLRQEFDERCGSETGYVEMNDFGDQFKATHAIETILEWKVVVAF
jgi:hypothetical protein